MALDLRQLDDCQRYLASVSTARIRERLSHHPGVHLLRPGGGHRVYACFLYKPLMTADNDGLWIGNSVEGGECSGCSPPSALYYVAPGSDSADVAIPAPHPCWIVCWLLGSGDHLWLGIGHERSGCTQESIRRLDGTDFQPVFTVAGPGL